MERCPACNARLTGTVTCPRCHAYLGQIKSSEQLGQLCLSHAMDFWFTGQPQIAIQSLILALKLKRTPAAVVLADFIVRKQMPQVLSLLIQQKINPAKQHLEILQQLQPGNELIAQLLAFIAYWVDKNNPRHELLKQLQAFTDYIKIQQP